MPELNKHRGRMIRCDRQMPDENTRLFLSEQCVAQVGTCDAAGWPCVVALMCVYESGDRLYLHTGSHHGHFLANIQQNPKICKHVGESGLLQRGKPSPCDSPLRTRARLLSAVFRFLKPALRMTKRLGSSIG
jgi:uncharacterized protein